MPERYLPLVVPDALLGLKEAATELGIDIAPELKEIGIAPELLDGPSGFLAMESVINLLNTVATKYRCPHLGLLIGRHRPRTRFGILSQMIKVCPDVGTALRKGHAHVKTISENTHWELTVESEFATIIRTDRQSINADMTQLHILSITQYFELLVALLGENWRPAAVYFVHKAPQDTSQYKKTFQAPVYFEQTFDGFIFPAKDLRTAIPTYDPVLLALIERHIETLEEKMGDEDICSKTRRIIRQTIGTSACTQVGIAQYLGLHTKTLQRMLKASNGNFKQLLLDERKNLAEHYLSESDISLLQISSILGYNSASAFSRSFTQQHGLPPKKWRETQQHGDTISVTR